MLGLIKARRQKADEVIFTKNGFALEAATGNIFVLVKKTIITPPADGSILPRVSRARFLNILRRQGITAVERNLAWPELETATEIILINGLAGPFPVIALDGNPLPYGENGCLFQCFQQLWRDVLSGNTE
jgi:branched-subunit amino acid aminotransferase/4-amino-4-deoxychorismate lyase